MGQKNSKKANCLANNSDLLPEDNHNEFEKNKIVFETTEEDGFVIVSHINEKDALEDFQSVFDDPDPHEIEIQ